LLRTSPLKFAAVTAFFIWRCGLPGSAFPVDIDGDSLRMDTVRIVIDTTHPPISVPPPEIVSESIIPPATASFGVKRNRVYTYISSIDSAAIDQDHPLESTTPPLSGGFPEVQRIVCQSVSADGDSTIFQLVNNARIRNVQARLAPRNIPAFQRFMATARVDSASGRVLREFSQISSRPNQVDTLVEKYSDFVSTLWDFYGRWMLHLSDEFSYVRDEQVPLAGLRRISLTVAGRETIDERECFVVQLTRGQPGREGTRRTYWVDVVDRVTVKVAFEAFVFELIVPSKDTTETSTKDSSAHLK